LIYRDITLTKLHLLVDRCSHSVRFK